MRRRGETQDEGSADGCALGFLGPTEKRRGQPDQYDWDEATAALTVTVP